MFYTPMSNENFAWIYIPDSSNERPLTILLYRRDLGVLRPFAVT